jgi:hypothetical protein
LNRLGGALGRILPSVPSPRLAASVRLIPPSESLRKCAATEGKVYESLEAKQAAADAYLKKLNADPVRIKRLCGWGWIQEALETLPPAKAA